MVTPKDTCAFRYLTSPVKDVANPLGIIFVFDSGKTGLNHTRNSKFSMDVGSLLPEFFKFRHVLFGIVP